MTEIIEIPDSPLLRPESHLAKEPPQLAVVSAFSYSRTATQGQKPPGNFPPAKGTTQQERPDNVPALPAASEGGCPAQSSIQATRSPLKIVFVDSNPYHKNRRLRRRPMNITNTDFDAASELFEDAADDASCNFRGNGSGEDSDHEYCDANDERPLKRRKIGRRRLRTSKSKRHQALSAADKDLVLRAEKGLSLHEVRKSWPRKTTNAMSKARAGALVRQIMAKIDWDEAIRVIEDVRLTGEKIRVKDKNSGINSDTATPVLRFKQYWKKMLTKSVLNLNMN